MRVLTRLSSVVASTALALTLASAPAVAFTPTSPSGVDVSGHQRGHGPIRWQEVAAAGQQFAFVKTSEGEDWVNEHYLEDVHAAHQAGLLVGTYHYARPAGDARVQAAHYAATLANAPQHALPPVLDIEVDEGLTPEQLQDWVRDFLAETERLTGRVPMIYTYRYFWREHLNDTDEFSHYPLWLAAYQNHVPEPVGGWDALSFWQRSDAGRVPGIDTNVDLNLFNGTGSQLGDFVAGRPVDLDGAAGQVVVPDNTILDTLGGDNTALAALILAAQTGVVPPEALEAAAAQLGIEQVLVDEITTRVRDLIATGDLPVGDLQVMVDNPDYTIGDLLILLTNAG
ncbi:glycoside hydrolase family 25 protein [Corynebacterium sp.]|uniref:glycoside hydrolase family 25 protein n=1 Tax=Corynebacterium sp. TaxID=1720 RepID=UPI0026E0C818|nr:glycoside hydrolase family 25 protein [Corynebacterium sp.]MDO5511886.1 glycoside hydrolase family 25 protein [Corynebacterium sp.]